MKKEEIYKEMEERMVVEGKMVENKNKKWKKVNKKMKDWEIEEYIKGEKKGKREVFEEKVMEEG